MANANCPPVEAPDDQRRVIAEHYADPLTSRAGFKGNGRPISVATCYEYITRSQTFTERATTRREPWCDPGLSLEEAVARDAYRVRSRRALPAEDLAKRSSTLPRIGGRSNCR